MSRGDCSRVVWCRFATEVSVSSLTGRGRKLVVRARGSALGVTSEVRRFVGLSLWTSTAVLVDESLDRKETGFGCGVGDKGASCWRVNVLVAVDAAFTASGAATRPGVVFRADSVFEMEARPWLSFLRNLLPALSGTGCWETFLPTMFTDSSSLSWAASHRARICLKVRRSGGVSMAEAWHRDICGEVLTLVAVGTKRGAWEGKVNREVATRSTNGAKQPRRHGTVRIADTEGAE